MHAVRCALAICLSLLLLASNASGRSSADEKQVRDLYRRGLAGDKAAVEECIARLEQAVKSQPNDQLARVYLGSAYTLRSRDMGFGPKKLKVLKQGVAVMDEAVTAAPSDPKIRLARALTTSALPGILGYGASTRKDFEELALLADRAPEKFEPGDLQIVFYQAGLAAEKSGQKERAIARWRQALRHPVDPELTAKIKADLAQAERPAP